MRLSDEAYRNCSLCPRSCHVDRIAGERGRCGMGVLPVVARAGLHYWEEPCLSGTGGAGTVFFCGCGLGCVYCQNREISARSHTAGALPAGWRELTPKALSEVFLRLMRDGAHNIDLVTPDHFAPGIAGAIELARRGGLTVPIVWNSSGYESVDTIRGLDGLVDIYLVDMKYGSRESAGRYSLAPDYVSACMEAIAEMVRQTGAPLFMDLDAGKELSAVQYNELMEAGEDDYTGPLMERGVIVRHLLLPGQERESILCGDGVWREVPADSRRVVDMVLDNFGDSVYLSLMSQYTPMVTPLPELQRRVEPEEYDALISYAIERGLENGFLQGEGTDSESFIPAFDGYGV